MIATKAPGSSKPNVYREIIALALAQWVKDFNSSKADLRRLAHEDFVIAARGPENIPLLEVLAVMFGMDPQEVLGKIIRSVEANLKAPPPPPRRTKKDQGFLWSEPRDRRGEGPKRERVQPMITPSRGQQGRAMQANNQVGSILT